MSEMLINATQSSELRVAIVENGILQNLDIERSGVEQKKSNIYKGRISSIEPSLGAIFVDYGCERHGFLPLKEISKEYFLSEPTDPSNPDMRKLLKTGQELVIQVEKEERGNKGAALTTFISLAGAYLVLMPNSPKAGGISRRIEGTERDQLRDALNQLKVPEGMGLIVRTAGLGKGKEELEWDFNILLQYWEAVKQAAIEGPAPYLIHQEGDAMIRSIRENLRQEPTDLIIDDADCYQSARNYLDRVRPNFSDKLKLYSEKLPLFSQCQIEQQIERAYQREIRLRSGGSIVIDHTEALVSVDINSARATRGGNIEETALNINLEAAEEIARQLRIRDIGGLIVIDFIDMSPLANRMAVENCLRQSLRKDRARIQIGRISRFGLLEMSRQRIRSALTRSNLVTCPRCSGQGTIRSVESLAHSLVHLIQEQAAKAPQQHFLLQLPVDVATYMLNEKRDVLSELEQQNHTRVTIVANPAFATPHYHLKVTKESGDKGGARTPSYEMTYTPKIEAEHKKTRSQKTAVEPAVKQYLPTESAKKAKASGGILKKIAHLLFGAPTKKPAPTTTQRPSRNAGQQTQRRTQQSSSQRRYSGNRNRNRNQSTGKTGTGTNRRTGSGTNTRTNPRNSSSTSGSSSGQRRRPSNNQQRSNQQRSNTSAQSRQRQNRNPRSQQGSSANRRNPQTNANKTVEKSSATPPIAKESQKPVTPPIKATENTTVQNETIKQPSPTAFAKTFEVHSHLTQETPQKATGPDNTLKPTQPEQKTAPTAKPAEPMQKTETAPTAKPAEPMQKTETAPTAKPAEPMQKTETAPTAKPAEPMQKTQTAPTAKPAEPMQKTETAPAPRDARATEKSSNTPPENSSSADSQKATHAEIEHRLKKELQQHTTNKQSSDEDKETKE